MVFDKLDYVERYYGLGERFRRALEWLKSTDVSSIVPGERVEIAGDDIYATLFCVDTLPVKESKLEAHHNYADLQYLVSGAELLGYAQAGTMAALSEYDEKGDIQFFNGDWDTLTLTPGMFYIVWPQDLHAPRVAAENISHITRLVVKIKL